MPSKENNNFIDEKIKINLKNFRITIYARIVEIKIFRKFFKIFKALKFIKF